MNNSSIEEVKPKEHREEEKEKERVEVVLMVEDEHEK